ncbi:MAG: hypothetical protein WCF95_00260 [bacterium]
MKILRKQNCNEVKGGELSNNPRSGFSALLLAEVYLSGEGRVPLGMTGVELALEKCPFL